MTGATPAVTEQEKATEPLVALIHATPLGIAPTRAAFADAFPEAVLWNLLDDRLMVEADAAGGLTEPLRRRMATLVGHAVAGGAGGVLLTCSMYGPVLATEAERHGVPMLGSDEAMYREAVERAPGRVAVLGTTTATAADSARRLREALGDTGRAADVVPFVVRGGLAAATRGDTAALRDALRNAAAEAAAGADLILVAQYSLTPGYDAAWAAELGTPVLSPSHLAARALRHAVLAAAR